MVGAWSKIENKPGAMVLTNEDHMTLRAKKPTIKRLEQEKIKRKKYD